MTIYWDACLFLDYLNGARNGLEIVAPHIEAMRQRNEMIFTSTLSLTEVAYAQHERTSGQLDPDVSVALNDLFRDQSLISLVEFDQRIAIEARDLIRRTLPDQRRLEPADAIHLASAVAAGTDEFWTFDKKLLDLATVYGVVDAISPSAPESTQLRMFGF